MPDPLFYTLCALAYLTVGLLVRIALALLFGKDPGEGNALSGALMWAPVLLACCVVFASTPLVWLFLQLRRFLLTDNPTDS